MDAGVRSLERQGDSMRGIGLEGREYWDEEKEIRDHNPETKGLSESNDITDITLIQFLCMTWRNACHQEIETLSRFLEGTYEFEQQGVVDGEDWSP